MKTLIIARHAKAEVLPAHKTDFERKLTDSGKADAEAMALMLTSQIKCPDIFQAMQNELSAPPKDLQLHTI